MPASKVGAAEINNIRFPAILFGLQAVVLIDVGIREAFTGSLIGTLLAWSLAVLAALQIRTLDKLWR